MVGGLVRIQKVSNAKEPEEAFVCVCFRLWLRRRKRKKGKDPNNTAPTMTLATKREMREKKEKSGA